MSEDQAMTASKASEVFDIREARERIATLERELADANHWRARHCRDAEAATKQSGENWQKWKAAELDAGRYRWLREQNWNEAKMFVVRGGKERVFLATDCPSHERLDELIDAALRRSAP